MTLDEKLIELYLSGKSTYEIAEIVGNKWYANKVRRRLAKLGIQFRDKSSAQANALKSNRAPHPTLGKHHSVETKSIIGKSVSDSWTNLSDQERERRSLISKQNWDLMSDGEKEKLREASAKAIRRAADEGSKAEKFFLRKLGQSGWRVEFHSTKRMPVQNLQID